MDEAEEDGAKALKFELLHVKSLRVQERFLHPVSISGGPALPLNKSGRQELR